LATRRPASKTKATTVGFLERNLELSVLQASGSVEGATNSVGVVCRFCEFMTGFLFALLCGTTGLAIAKLATK